MPSIGELDLQRALGDAYTIERELGGGGMSRVYVARETALGRDVVVKVLAPELAAGVSVARFAREIAIAARLQQANIVPVLTAGTAGDLPYYTMPFVRGESLRALLARGVALPLPERLGVLRDVARALAFAHDNGIVHRDIKPENVLLSGGAAVVTDFGIAKALGVARASDGTTSPAADGTLTGVGSSIGTPAYMAPEQAVGDVVDVRADLYAWGVVAYELLAGTHPFAASTGTAQLVAAHLVEVPRPLRERNGEVSVDVAALVMQCLAKQPAARPDSAGAVLARLDAAVTPAAAAPHARGATRGRATRTAVVAVSLLVVASFVAWRVRTTPADVAAAATRTVVVVPFDNLGDSSNAYFAEGISEEIGSQLARLPNVQVIGRAGVRRYRASEKTPREIGRVLGAAYVLSGSVRWERAGGSAVVNGETRVRIVPALVNVRSGLQEWGEPFNERLTDVFKVQADVAERVANALSITLGAVDQSRLRRPESADPAARDAQLLGRYFLRRRGLENLRRATMEFQRAIRRDSMYARAWAGYSEAIGLLPAYLDTVSEARATAEAQRSAERAVALDGLLPEAHVALARALWNDFRFTASLAAIDRAIRLDPSSALALQQRQEVLLALGRVDEAAVTLRRAVALDGFVPLLQFERAIPYFAQGHPDSALAAIDSAIAIDNGESTYWYGLRSFTLAQLGRPDDALQSCRRFMVSVHCRLIIAARTATAAQRAELNALLATMKRNWRLVDPPMSPTLQAIIRAWLGDRHAAFERLSAALAEHDPNVASLVYFPAFDFMHDDPRWTALLRDIRSR